MPDGFEDGMVTYARDIAGWQLEKLERELRSHIQDYPEFARAVELMEDADADLIQKLSGDESVTEDIQSASNAYAATLAIEMYIRGVLDGGRLCHAFLTREFPRKEDAK